MIAIKGQGMPENCAYLNVHGNMNIFIPEYERYEKEFGNEQTKEYLKGK